MHGVTMKFIFIWHLYTVYLSVSLTHTYIIFSAKGLRRNKAVVAQSDIPSQNLPGQTEEIHAQPQSLCMAG